MIFTTNLGMTSPENSIFPRGRNEEQQVAIERRHLKVKVEGPLMLAGRPFTVAEMEERRTAPSAVNATAAAATAASKSDSTPTARPKQRRIIEDVYSDSESEE